MQVWPGTFPSGAANCPTRESIQHPSRGVRDTEVDERGTPIGAATVRERLPVTHLANAPLRSRLTSRRAHVFRGGTRARFSSSWASRTPSEAMYGQSSYPRAM